MQSAETVLDVLRERGRRGLPLDEIYRQLFNPVGGPNQPDFVGLGVAAGLNFDITTPAQIGPHLARPGYGQGLNVVTYQRPQLFRLFP